MAVNAGTAHEEVDAAVGSDLVFITLAFRFEVFRHTVEDVDVFCGDVDVVED